MSTNTNKQDLGLDIMVDTIVTAADVSWVSAYLKVSGAPEKSVGIACDDDTLYLVSGLKGVHSVTVVEAPMPAGAFTEYDPESALQALLSEEGITIAEDGAMSVESAAEAKSLPELIGDDLQVGERWQNKETSENPLESFQDAAAYLSECFPDNYTWD